MARQALAVGGDSAVRARVGTETTGSLRDRSIGTQGARGPHGARGNWASAAVIGLCRVWAAYTVKRAIADASSTSDRDYREFGLDKGEMLAALERLRDELAHGGKATCGVERRNPPLAILVSRRKRTALDTR